MGTYRATVHVPYGALTAEQHACQPSTHFPAATPGLRNLPHRDADPDGLSESADKHTLPNLRREELHRSDCVQAGRKQAESTGEEPEAQGCKAPGDDQGERVLSGSGSGTEEEQEPELMVQYLLLSPFTHTGEAEKNEGQQAK